MRLLPGLRASLIAFAALAFSGVSPSAYADSGAIRISVVKGGWFIGAQGGSGVLTFRGRSYPLSVGGLSYGLTFGGSQTNFVGRVTNINRPSDVAGRVGARRALLGRQADH